MNHIPKVVDLRDVDPLRRNRLVSHRTPSGVRCHPAGRGPLRGVRARPGHSRPHAGGSLAYSTDARLLRSTVSVFSRESLYGAPVERVVSDNIPNMHAQVMLDQPGPRESARIDRKPFGRPTIDSSQKSRVSPLTSRISE